MSSCFLLYMCISIALKGGGDAVGIFSVSGIQDDIGYDALRSMITVILMNDYSVRQIRENEPDI